MTNNLLIQRNHDNQAAVRHDAALPATRILSRSGRENRGGGATQDVNVQLLHADRVRMGRKLQLHSNVLLVQLSGVGELGYLQRRRMRSPFLFLPSILTYFLALCFRCTGRLAKPTTAVSTAAAATDSALPPCPRRYLVGYPILDNCEIWRSHALSKATCALWVQAARMGWLVGCVAYARCSDSPARSQTCKSL